MNYYQFFKKRLELSGSYVELLMISDKYLYEEVSYQREEKLRIEIIKSLHQNYLDYELPELKHQLDVLLITKDFIKHKEQINLLSEKELVDRIGTLSKRLLHKSQYIDEQLQSLATQGFSQLSEISFRDLKQEYLKNLMVRQLKYLILNRLKNSVTAEGQLTYIFDNF